jgi:hypothetical protein
MPGRKRSGEWYSPYFAPSTVVVGVLVIIISISAGRYVGNVMIERDKSRYTPTVNLAAPTQRVGPTKTTHATPLAHGKVSPSAKLQH